MKGPLTTAGCALLFLLSGIAVAEYLAQTKVALAGTESAIVEPPTEFDPAPPALAVTPSARQPDHGAEVRQLIQERLPEAPTDVVDVLVDEYRQLSLDDIEFILEQRRRSGVIQPASLTADWPTQAVPESDENASSPTTPSDAVTSAMAVVEHVLLNNLLCATTPGYRRQLAVLDIVGCVNACHHVPARFTLAAEAQPCCHGDDTQALRSLHATVHREWQFDAGRSISSGNPLHVALPDDGHLMFALEDGTTLTRRGDFRILSDGSVGITAAGQEWRLQHSPLIPTDCTDLRIDPQGGIRGSGPDGADQQFGRVTVVRFQESRQLSSDDGVFFRATESPDSPHPMPTDAILLQTESLELSNVDRAQEWVELEHLRRMRSECLPFAGDLP